MGAKSKTKSRGRPSKTPTRTTRSSACPPPVVDVEGEPARSDPGMNEGPCPDPAGPKWHPATQLNSPSNLDHNQSDHRTVRNKANSNDSSGPHLSASPPRGTEASRTRKARRTRGRSGAPDTYQSLSISEVEALEGRGISPSDIELWIELQFDFNQIDRWFRAGFDPIKAQQWEGAGFSPACASIWPKAGIDLEWAKIFRQLRKRTGEAKPWMKLFSHKEEIQAAIQNKLPLNEAEPG
ncbi:hypothetical protein DSO57_1034157 [Entomophthora muscae]|uniref:Uncharacterized protein n=1 Tax=Entomophthora muscae TaxID=34485 RepID=A0ACC2S226_9FUNG|nr:hypothetical protein DSO57_1034157 [Entomophthora muscae]